MRHSSTNVASPYPMMPRGPRARHVVFADALRWQRRIDIAPQEERAASTPRARFAPEDGAFVRWLFEQAGLDAGHYRVETLRRRLGACLRALRVSSTVEARCLLQSDGRLVPTAVSALLIGVTSFFRDPAVWTTLHETVFPALFAGRHPLRLWSAGCSDGAETYSVALLLAELGLLERALVLGTDCRPDALRHARAGLFDAAALSEVPRTARARYFHRVDERWQVVEPLRAAITWRIGNLMRLSEPGSWDVILCRNVAIYMESRPGAELWRTLEACLRPGGVLVVGKAERPIEAKGLVALAPCIYRRELV